MEGGREGGKEGWMEGDLRETEIDRYIISLFDMKNIQLNINREWERKGGRNLGREGIYRDLGKEGFREGKI